MTQVLPATLTASVPKRASASGPLGVYCCHRAGKSATCSVQIPGEGWGGRSWDECSGCQGEHIGTSFPQTVKTPFKCIWSILARKEGATDVDRVDQPLEHKWADTELCQVLSELEVNAWCLAQDLHLFASSGGSHGELRHRFQLRRRDAQSKHCLRRDEVGEGVAAVNEGCGGQVSQSDQDIPTVVLSLTGLEIDLRNLGAICLVGHTGSSRTAGDFIVTLLVLPTGSLSGILLILVIFRKAVVKKY